MVKHATVLEETEKEAPVEPTAFDQFVDHQKKAMEEFGKAFAALLPEGLREHGESAVKEMVEGYRGLFNSTLDDIIKRIERSKIEERPSDKKTRVPIQ